MVKTADALAQVAKSLEANTEMLKTMKDTMQDATMSGEEMIKVQKATIGFRPCYLTNQLLKKGMKFLMPQIMLD